MRRFMPLSAAKAALHWTELKACKVQASIVAVFKNGRRQSDQVLEISAVPLQL